MTKRLLASPASSPEDQMQAKAAAISDRFRTRDAAEGVRAFVERRRPTFAGLPD